MPAPVRKTWILARSLIGNFYLMCALRDFPAKECCVDLLCFYFFPVYSDPEAFIIRNTGDQISVLPCFQATCKAVSVSGKRNIF